MNRLMKLSLGVLWTLSLGCGAHHGSKARVASPTPTQLPPGLTDEKVRDIGGAAWVVPSYLDTATRNLQVGESLDTAIDLNLTAKGGTQNHAVRLFWGLSVENCDTSAVADRFVENISLMPPDNAPEALQLDGFEMGSSWSETNNFSGRTFVMKSYKSSEETGIYHLGGLVANELSSTCTTFRIVIKPKVKTSAQFIESSPEFKELVDSLDKTWKGFGAELGFEPAE